MRDKRGRVSCAVRDPARLEDDPGQGGIPPLPQPREHPGTSTLGTAPQRATTQADTELPGAALTLKFNRALLCGCLQTMMVGMSRATRSSTRATIQPTLASFRAFTSRVRTTQITVISVAAREGAVRGLHSSWPPWDSEPHQWPG